MKSIEQIKNEVAKDYGYDSMEAFIYTCTNPNTVNLAIDEAMILFATQYCEQQREMCAEDLPTNTPELTIECILNTPLAV